MQSGVVLGSAVAELSMVGPSMSYVVCHATVVASAVLLCAQNVIQSYFREWLHSTGNIRQVREHVWIGTPGACVAAFLAAGVHAASRGFGCRIASAHVTLNM